MPLTAEVAAHQIQVMAPGGASVMKLIFLRFMLVGIQNFYKCDEINIFTFQIQYYQSQPPPQHLSIIFCLALILSNLQHCFWQFLAQSTAMKAF